jgi:hypothetical protein
MDPSRNAYATLELSPSASPAEVREQYKRLVRRWHPDQFVDDPQGQADAARQMRQINVAYALIQEATAREDRPVPPASSPAGSPGEQRGAPLSREAIDGIVQSVGTESPLDVLRGFLAWSWPLFLALLIGPPRYQWLTDELAGRPHSSVALWQVLLVALAVVLRLRRSKRGSGKGPTAP